MGSDEMSGVYGSEAEALRSAFPPADALDEFGVPVNLLGPHPPEVWGAIGRTVAIAALLEDRLVALLQMLTLREQSAYAKSSPTAVIAALRKQGPVDEPTWAGWDRWLDHAVDAFEWRNHIVHDLWPAQPGDRFFGHRLSRSGERINMDTTRDELMRQLVELAEVTAHAQGWIAAAGAESGRRWAELTRAERVGPVARSDGDSTAAGKV